MEKKRPLILITNDDGYFAKGIQSLAEAVSELGDVVVVAPNGPRSGMSSALTIVNPIRYYLHSKEGSITTYICTGTPVDCIKIAMNEIVDRKPNIVVTGINHGANSAVAVLYSGTMGAAMEGCLFDVPSIGFSYLDHAMDGDFSEAKRVAKIVTERVLKDGLPSGTCLNVNIPVVPKVKGIKIGRQCKGKWDNEIVKSKDGANQNVYWLAGQFISKEENDAKDSDNSILDEGYVSVVPIKVDMTDYEYMKSLSSWEELI